MPLPFTSYMDSAGEGQCYFQTSVLAFYYNWYYSWQSLLFSLNCFTLTVFAVTLSLTVITFHHHFTSQNDSEKLVNIEKN